VRDVAGREEGYLTDFARFEKEISLNGQSWVTETRRAAISRFAELGFPTTRHEEWKYTSVVPITKIPFKPAGHELRGLTANKVQLITFGNWDCNQVVFVNGFYSAELSSHRQLPGAVNLGSLAMALSTHRDLVEPHLARYAGYEDHPFTALNTAFMRDGAFMNIPDGGVVEDPIHLIYLSTVGSEPTVSHPRNMIVLGKNSQATIVESYVGLGDGVYFTNAVTEILMGENSVVDHYRLQRESEKAFHISTLQVQQNRSTTFSGHSVSIGGTLVRNNVNAVLDGEGVDCTLNGLYLVTGRQHVDNHTRIDHVRPHGTSRELYKGILDEESRGVFNGKVVVWKDAQKTDARQTNKNLLLSKDAEINSKPQLEILADDVKCTHGTTVGQLEEEQLFYLRSRGLDREVAQGLLTQGFASDTINRIRIDAIRSALEGIVLRWFLKDKGYGEAVQ
jgi:Fe-S cluster assembly protein SufD